MTISSLDRPAFAGPALAGERKERLFIGMPSQGGRARRRAPAPAVALDGSFPPFFYRLSQAAQRWYLRSAAVERFELEPRPSLTAMAAGLSRALERGFAPPTARAAQALADEVCRLLGVKQVRVEVKEVRPRNARGELYGLFFPARRLIVLWMRTARRHDVVKPRTFARTLMHELVHHLDYALLGLGESFHTPGFFKRESFLVKTLYGERGGKEW